LPTDRGDLLAKLPRFAEARSEFERAVVHTRTRVGPRARPRVRRR
jgi:predicted RNA polymerase sigma factor